MRYGIKSFQFIYVHPSHLVTMALACLMIVASRKKRAWKLFVVFAVVLIASSLRSRWVALAFIIAVFFLVGEQRLKKSVGLVVAAAALCAMVLGASQMEVYYGSSSPSARNHLAQAALDIFWRGFPFGTGFGTYGTGVTKSDYSELYMQYGFDEVPGLSPNFSSYLTDTFWPAIMAQFGFFGLLVWLLLLGFIGCKIYRYGVAHDRMILALAFLATLLIASTASGAIFSTQMITLLFVYYLVVGTSKIEMDE